MIADSVSPPAMSNQRMSLAFYIFDTHHFVIRAALCAGTTDDLSQSIFDGK